MATSAHTRNLPAPHRPAVADQLIRVTTALAVAAVAAVAAVISYWHAYELVTSHGETGLTAKLLPFTVNGLILAASMLILDASRRPHPCHHWPAGAWAPGSPPPSAPTWPTAWDHGPIGALVSAWAALALAGSFELLMTLIRTEPHAQTTAIRTCHTNQVRSARAGRAQAERGFFVEWSKARMA